MSSKPFSFDFNFPARFQVHDALKGGFAVRKASNERHTDSGRRSIFRGRSFAWTCGTGPASEENRVLDRTYFDYYVPFFISLEGSNNRVSLYVELLPGIPSMLVHAEKKNTEHTKTVDKCCWLPHWVHLSWCIYEVLHGCLLLWQTPAWL